MLSDFQNYVTIGCNSRNLQQNPARILPHLKRVIPLPCETSVFKFYHFLITVVTKPNLGHLAHSSCTPQNIQDNRVLCADRVKKVEDCSAECKAANTLDIQQRTSRWWSQWACRSLTERTRYSSILECRWMAHIDPPRRASDSVSTLCPRKK